MALNRQHAPGVVVDDTATRHELAIERRELRQSLGDTVRWLAARGLVTASGWLPRRVTAGVQQRYDFVAERSRGGAK
jgi:hypothetical protein